MTNLIEKVLFLEKVEIFQDLSLDELGQIAEITDTQQFQEDEILFHQGDPGNYAYIIVTGEVELFLETGKKESQTLQIVGSGTCFGEMALLDGQMRSAGARVKKNSLISRINREDFLRVMINYPSIAAGIISQLSSRLRKTNEMYNTLKSGITDFADIYKKIAPIIGKEI